MRFDMVTLKIRCATALAAVSTFFDNIRDYFSRSSFSLASSAAPIWMVFSRKLLTVPYTMTDVRAIVSRTSAALSYFELFAAYLTGARYHRFRSAWTYLNCAFYRTGVCFSSIMGAVDFKSLTAGGADQGNFTSTLDFSRSSCHG